MKNPNWEVWLNADCGCVVYIKNYDDETMMMDGNEIYKVEENQKCSVHYQKSNPCYKEEI